MPDRFTPRRLAIAWTLGILAACSVPGAYIPDVPLFSPDKLAHIGLFAVFGWLWLRAAPHRVGRVVLGGVAFAGFIEVWQQALPIGRMAELGDVIADLLGLALAVGAWSLSRRSRASATAKKSPSHSNETPGGVS